MVITTPSGYKVTFKSETELTYGDRRLIKRAMLKSVKISQGETGLPSFTGEIAYDMADETLRVMLKQIETPDGKVLTENLFDVVMSWTTPEDGDAVYAEIDKLKLNEAQVETKKAK